MRPGPGLVVMALAFISGARRGSTSTSSKITSSSKTSSSSSSSHYYSSSPSSQSLLPSTSNSHISSESRASTTSSQSFLFPSYLAGGGVLTPAGTPFPPTAPSSDYNYYYHDNYPQPSFVLPDKLRHHYDPPRAKTASLLPPLTPTGASSRATRVTRGARNSDIAARAGGGATVGEVNNDNDDSSSSSDSADVDPAAGLLVQFPSHSADSSTSFDEDDILALVAEDDLLSEESFDRLTKLTDDKIGYINEEDYVEFGEAGREAVSGAGVGGGSGVENSVEVFSKSADYSATVAPLPELQQRDEVRTDSSLVGAVDRETEDVDAIGVGIGVGGSYVANLVSKNAATLADSALSSAQQDLNDIAAATEVTDFKQLGLDSPVFDSTSSLTRINPWLSACDLAQPSTAPDLQGQCTAGTLPVAWVDEGPGPPTCPKSCEQIRLENNMNKNNFNNNHNNKNKNLNDNNKYLIDANSINFKLNQLVNSNNNNYNYNNNINNRMMAKVRREVNDNNSNNKNNGAAATTAAPTWRTTITASALNHETAAQQQQAHMQQNGLHVAAADEAAYVVDDLLLLSNHNRNTNNNNINNNNSNNNNKQSQNNNNIVKLNTHPFNLNNYDLKYSNLNQEPPSSRSSSNNNYYNFKQQQQQFATHSNSRNSNTPQAYQFKQQQQQQQQQHQCLDYLGDNEESSPPHLCQLQDPSVLSYKLRTLRLRHCCERNVFTALHTIALNATLSGGTQCVRVLSDIMELDSLATRITCELAEILFRFDCRQVYSLINQCDDCKEAYRRWVCTTLIPYFAEQNDTIAANATKNTTNNNSNSNNNNNNDNKNNNYNSTTTTSNSTNSYNKNINNNNNNKAENRNKLLNNNNIENLYKADNNNNLFINNDKNKNQENLIYNNNNNNNDYFNDNINKRSERRTGRSTNAAQNAVAAFYEAIDCSGNSRSQSNSNKNSNNKKKFKISSNSNNYATFPRRERDADGRCIRKASNAHQQQQRQQQQSEANNFISTATNEDPSVEDPVISKLLKRSKRKVEFRKRRRIRPCLSVCQTVEQKCPYLLPADRAPALPTQYAGEPTFLCLDPNIAETGEQQRKSNHGPPDCCYRYCDHPTFGICTYCNEFAATPPPDKGTITPTNATNATNGTAAAPTQRIHNITLTSSTGSASVTHQRIGSVAIALLNVSTARMELDVERLPYYAYFAGTYYYDDVDEMPHEALPECSPVPSVSTRCTIPYYASTAATGPKTRAGSGTMRALMLCLSAMFCLINSYYVMSANRWGNGSSNYYYYMLGNVQVWELRNSSKISRISRSRSSSRGSRRSSVCFGRVRIDELKNRRKITAAGNTAREKCSSNVRNKMSIGTKIIRNNYADDDEQHKTSAVNCNCSQSRCSKKISSRFSSNISTNLNINKNNSCNKSNYHFHYFYNFNINDLWRRWWIRGGHASCHARSS